MGQSTISPATAAIVSLQRPLSPTAVIRVIWAVYRIPDTGYEWGHIRTGHGSASTTPLRRFAMSWGLSNDARTMSSRPCAIRPEDSACSRRSGNSLPRTVSIWALGRSRCIPGKPGADRHYWRIADSPSILPETQQCGSFCQASDISTNTHRYPGSGAKSQMFPKPDKFALAGSGCAQGLPAQVARIQQKMAIKDFPMLGGMTEIPAWEGIGLWPQFLILQWKVGVARTTAVGNLRAC